MLQREYFVFQSCYILLKCSFFNQIFEICKQNMIKEQKAISRNCPRGIPDDRLTRQDFKSAIISIFSLPNKLKQSIRTLYQKHTEYSHPTRD